MRVLLVGCREQPWFPAYELKAALQAGGHSCRYVPRIERVSAVARQVAAQPRLLITLQGRRRWRDWKPEYVRECRERGVATVLWCTEPLTERWFLELARSHDVVLHSLGGMIDRLKSHGLDRCFYMPLAFHDPLFQMRNASENRRDAFSTEVAFVGTMESEYRQHLVRALMAEGFSLKWWGPPLSTPSLALPRYFRERSLRGVHAGRTVYGPDYAAVAAAAGVFLGLDGDPQMDRSWGCRLYWALGCGATYLCRRLPGLEDVFESGRHLETFEDAEDCAVKVRLLLNKPRVRVRFSVQGRQEILASHSYAVRLRHLAEITTELVGLDWR